jgi:creatinine amidohydrolase/Fe(II)-dependent formamide hydrolase-like protein
VPIGGTEQSGAHLVLGKHNARVRVLAGRIAEALGNAIVAPVLAYVPEGAISPPTQHMKFPGTISIPEAAFEQLLEGTARSLAQAGFRDVYFLGDHGGYQANLKHVADRLAHDKPRPGAAPFHAHALEAYYRVTQTAYVDALKARGHTPAEIGQHAGLADTSLSLALAPEGVRTGALAAASSPQAQPGVAGDPRKATVALGQVGAALVVEQSVAAIRASAGRP